MSRSPWQRVLGENMADLDAGLRASFGAKVLRAPFVLPAPRPVLEIGTALIRSGTELVLMSRWVLPEKLLAARYQFAYPDLEPAVRQIVEARVVGASGSNRR